MYDVVVVGLGVIGVGTVEKLSSEGYNVLAIEQGPFINPEATSHGMSRLLRLGSRDPDYADLLSESRSAWMNMQQSSDRRLFFSNGSIEIFHEAKSDRINKIVETCETGGFKYELYDGDEINEKFNLFSVPEFYQGIYTPDGGQLDARACMYEMFESAKSRENVTIKQYETVNSWTDNGTVSVSTNTNSYETKNLVIASGAWATEQSDKIKNLVNVHNHTYTHSLQVQSQLNKAPGFTIVNKDKPHIYGLSETWSDSVKFGGFLDTDNLLRRTPSDYTRGLESQRYNPEASTARTHLNISTAETERSSCMVSYTEDESPIIDYLSENTIVAVGMSGGGFKYAPAYARIITDKIQGSSTEHEEKFSINRF